MLAADVSKSNKSFLPNITFNLKLRSENGIIIVWMGLFLNLTK